MPLCRGCLPWAALCVWASVVVGTASAAPPQGVSVENVRVGLGENNTYKLGTWTPVWVQFRGGDERFSGTLEVVVPDDDGTPTSFRQVVDVGARQSQRVTTYARPGSNNPDFTLRLYDQSGRRHGDEVVASDRTRLTELRPQEILLATLGEPQGVEMIPSLSDFSDLANQAARGNVVTVARLDASGGLLPGRWYGYDAVQAVVLDTNDDEVMATLDALRGQALAEWVRRGGHLVVAVGANWQRVRDSFLGPILPCVPNGQERIGDLGTLESFAGANQADHAPGGPAGDGREAGGDRGARRPGAQPRGSPPWSCAGPTASAGSRWSRSTWTRARSPTGPTGPSSGSGRSTSAARRRPTPTPGRG